MFGRARGFVVSSTAVELVDYSPERVAITFLVGDTTNACSVILKDGDVDATPTNGVPLTFACGPLRIDGKLASHRWSAIRLAAVDCVVGVVEQFLGAGPVEPSPGVPA
jgi:hypothetical protein